MSDEQHEGEPNPRIDDACDSLATQLEQMRRERDEAIALREDADARAEACAASHASQLARLRDEREALQRVMRTWEMRYEEVMRERDEARRDRDAVVQRLGGAWADLAGARATNARLHRRAQGVDARKPDDEALIRRLRADVRGQAKHAGHVIGYVFRLRCALSDAQRAQSNAVRERDEARATIDAAWKATGVAGAVRGLTTLDDVVQCHRHDLMEARAKLARIREVAECDYHDTPRTVLRIIDEKEGGQ